MRLVLLTIAAAVALAGCGSGNVSRDVPAGEIKARPNNGYDGPNGGK